VLAHHHIGKAYLNYRCYEQAIDHLTIALKKNSRLTSIRSTKLYHTYILRALSRCYYEIASFEDALEVLTKAEEIQKTYHEDGQGDQSRPDLETLRLVANCHTKLKNYKKAHEYFERAQVNAKGEGPQLPKLQID
jgi:tetratricopeptide (TPR) repeat protein